MEYFFNVEKRNCRFSIENLLIHSGFYQIRSEFPISNILHDPKPNAITFETYLISHTRRTSDL